MMIRFPQLVEFPIFDRISSVQLAPFTERARKGTRLSCIHI